MEKMRKLVGPERNLGEDDGRVFIAINLLAAKSPLPL